MAIVINSAPTGQPSVHDNLWHIVSSTNSGQVDFKYVFDIFINGVQKIRVKQFPEPDNGRAYFDAGPTVRNEMTYAWFEPISDQLANHELNMSGEGGIVYAVRIGEDFSDVTTLNMASGQVSGYCWAPPMFQRRVTTLATKLNKWLTNRPLYANAKEGEPLYIGFYTAPGTTLQFKCETYDHSNTILSSNTQAGILFSTGLYQYNIGPDAINVTVLPITSSVKYYDCWFYDGVTNHEKFRVYLTCNNKYTPIPVHFLNRWGVYDTIRFDLASRLSMDVKRRDFGQRDYRFNGNSVDYYSTSNRYYEGKINYSNAANWTYKLNADALTDAEWEWIADLFTSPQILMEIDGYHYPVTIKKTNYDYHKFVNDKLKPLEVEFELNSTRMTQLR